MDPHEELGIITRELLIWNAGEEAAVTRLLPLIYEELRRLADLKLRNQPRGVLQPTELVHEFYLRFMADTNRDGQPPWENRAHFFSIAATVMRRILVDHWRRKSAERRSGQALDLTLDESLAAGFPSRTLSILAVDQALTRLEKIDPQQARIVELRFFTGLTNEEVAEIMKITDRTVKRKWTAARIWLVRNLSTTAGK